MIQNFKLGKSGQQHDFFGSMTTWLPKDKELIQDQIRKGLANPVFKDTDPVEVFNDTIRLW